MDWIFKAALGLGAYLFADHVVKETTGKRIHNHAFDWWAGLRDAVVNWANANGHLRVRRFILVLDDTLAALMGTGKKIRARVVAETPDGNRKVVTTREATPEELASNFPQLMNHRKVDITTLVQ
jgi:hypothetical protein